MQRMDQDSDDNTINAQFRPFARDVCRTRENHCLRQVVREVGEIATNATTTQMKTHASTVNLQDGRRFAARHPVPALPVISCVSCSTLRNPAKSLLRKIK